MIFKYKEPLYRHESNFYSNKGTKEIPTYILDFPDRGGVCLKQIGTKPIYEMIQANLVNCDLNSVIESCVHSNQYAVCTQDNLNSMIADYTGITNLGELYSSSKRLENTWHELPLEVRESFGSDLKSFIREIGSDSFDQKVTEGYEKFYGSISKNTNTGILPPDSGSTGSESIDQEFEKEINKEVKEV